MGNQHNTLKTTITPITDEALVSGIKTDLINPTYFSDIKSNLRSRSFWKTTGEITDAFSKIFTGVAAIIAFAAGFFGYTFLAFIAGCFSTASLVLNHFSSYAMVQSKQHTDEVNEELSKLGLDNIINIAPDSVSDTHHTPDTPIIPDTILDTPTTPLSNSNTKSPSNSKIKSPSSSRVKLAANHGIVSAGTILTIEDEPVISPKSEIKDDSNKDVKNDITSETSMKPQTDTQSDIKEPERKSKLKVPKAPVKIDSTEDKSDQVINV